MNGPHRHYFEVATGPTAGLFIWLCQVTTLGRVTDPTATAGKHKDPEITLSRVRTGPTAASKTNQHDMYSCHPRVTTIPFEAQSKTCERKI